MRVICVSTIYCPIHDNSIPSILVGLPLLSRSTIPSIPDSALSRVVEGPMPNISSTCVPIIALGSLC